MRNITLQIKVQWDKREWICIWKQRTTQKLLSHSPCSEHGEDMPRKWAGTEISSFSIKQKQEDLYLELTETEEVENMMEKISLIICIWTCELLDREWKSLYPDLPWLIVPTVTGLLCARSSLKAAALLDLGAAWLCSALLHLQLIIVLLYTQSCLGSVRWSTTLLSPLAPYSVFRQQSLFPQHLLYCIAVCLILGYGSREKCLGFYFCNS